MHDDNDDQQMYRNPPPARFLSGSATVKDDLQIIFDMERQIGAAVFQLHQLVNHLQENVEERATSEELAEGFEILGHSLTEVGEVLQENQSSIKEATDLLMPRLNKIDTDWSRIQRATNEVLRTNGIDPQTLSEESIHLKKLGKWMNTLQLIGVSILVTIASAWVMSSFSKTLIADQRSVNDQVLQQNQTILNQNRDLQRQLTEHIARDDERFHHSK
jgi:prophage DNA circulation protein